MGGILSILADLFASTVPTVIFVFVLFVIFNKFLYKPLTAVMKKREEETTGAMARAREQAASAEEKARQYEAAFQAARQEVYRQREAAGRSMLEDREAALDKAREQSEALTSEAQPDWRQKWLRTKKELLATCQSLGQEIAATCWGRRWRGGIRP